jgi:hypothetical protein
VIIPNPGKPHPCPPSPTPSCWTASAAWWLATAPHHALETALAAAKKRGDYALDQTRARRGPAVERFTLVLQAAIEELEGMAVALAAGEGSSEEGMMP